MKPKTMSIASFCALGWRQVEPGTEVFSYLAKSHSRDAASIMYEVDDSMLGEDAIHDTVGELANMIAGSAKVLLPGDVSLGQPEVLEEADLPEACLSSWPVINMASQRTTSSLRFALSLGINCRSPPRFYGRHGGKLQDKRYV